MNRSIFTFNSIRAKLVGIILFVSALGLLIAFTINIAVAVKSFRADLMNRMSLVVDLTGKDCILPLAFQDREGAADILRSSSRLPQVTSIKLYDAENRLFADYLKPGTPELISTDVLNLHKGFIGGSLFINQGLYEQGHFYGTIHFRISTSELNSRIRNYILTSSAVLALILAISLLLAGRLQELISGPIVKLSRMARDISKTGDYSLRAETASSDEIGTLYNGFNEMLGQVQSHEKALKQSEEKFRGMVMNLMEGFYNVTLEGKLLDYNDEFTRILGLDPDRDYQGVDLPDFWQDKGKRKEYVDKILADGFVKNHLIEARKADGTDIIVQANARLIREEGGQPLRIEGAFMDITESLKAEQQVKQQQFLMARAQEMGRIGTWELDMITSELSWTDQNYRNFGIPPGTPLNYETFLEYVHPADREYVNAEWTAALEGKPYDIEHRVVVDGDVKWVREKADITFDDNYKAVKAIGFTQDITYAKLAKIQLQEYSEKLEEMVDARTRKLQDTQEQLIRREKLASLGKLAGGVGHELRNPLGVISNSVYFLNTISDLDEAGREQLEIINEEIQKSIRIINELLEFGRVHTVMKENIDVKDAIERLLVKNPLPAAVKLNLDISGELPALSIDPANFEQIMTNLASNAVQAMDGSGKLDIWAGEIDSVMTITITDNGKGIAAGNMEKIFEPLFTTRSRGIGLGLALTKNLVEANGGRISVSSVEGEGTVFTLEFPGE